MTVHGVRWVDYARDQRDSLPAEARTALDIALRRLVEDPRGHSTYRKRDNQWTATFSDGWGLIVYTIEDRWITITVLRVTWLDG
ncbi:hypothetical protein FF36_01177 [Frankia torreyi]|uniref:Cytotoxic translational repressor of toxin-antitoxin stability system n=1 Tax=Frankia torreyi TaxID=1856 RepID=A0A0D8BLZ5_9ACTN|nr:MULTISPECIES: hypothetical protein [Frankia]KJE24447.1 hypothetical protein FF36_01177 [Frankia torreyi]KQC38404.1 hypothetical protein UK82_10205 [Frankia sp. ACN1ag]KQM06315.1 hypothetical protein FF86_100938 [Frankia sp. CpI1-P]